MVFSVPKGFPKFNELLTDRTQSVLVALKFPYDSMRFRVAMQPNQYQDLQDQAADDKAELSAESILDQKQLISSDFSPEIMQVLHDHIRQLPPEIQSLFDFYKGESKQRGTRYRLVVQSELAIKSVGGFDWVLQECNRLVNEFNQIKKELQKSFTNVTSEMEQLQNYYQKRIDKIKHAASLSELGPQVPYIEILREYQNLQADMKCIGELIKKSGAENLKLLQSRIQEDLLALAKRVNNKLMSYEKDADKSDRITKLKEMSSGINGLLNQSTEIFNLESNHKPPVAEREIIEEFVTSFEVEFAPGLTRELQHDEVGIVAHRDNNENDRHHDVEQECKKVVQHSKPSAIYVIPYVKYDERDAKKTTSSKRLNHYATRLRQEIDWMVDLTQHLETMGLTLSNSAELKQYYKQQIQHLESRLTSLQKEVEPKNNLYRYFNKPRDWLSRIAVKKTFGEMLRTLEGLKGESSDEKTSAKIEKHL